MSIGAHALGESAVSAQPAAATSSTAKPSKRRQATAKADATAMPEAR